MSTNIKDAIWKSCELLAKEKKLITVKNIKTKLYSLGYQYYKDLDDVDNDITSLINKWRITKLDKSCNKKQDFNIYTALAIPSKDDQNTLASLKRKIFTLECELNKYKHAACRANKKTKLLEKKLHTIIANTKKERQEFIANLKDMLLN